MKVTLICSSTEILSFLDPEMSEHLRRQMGFLGLDLRRGTTLLDTVVHASEEAVLLRLSTGDLWTDRVLFATGRHGATGSLDLDLAGLTANDRGLIAVNENYQTRVPHIYAAGDVIGFPALEKATG